MPTKPCLNCAASFMARGRAIFCSHTCRVKYQKENRDTPPVNCDRVLSANFFLGDLKSELAELSKSPRGREQTRDALLTAIRAAMSQAPRWPDGSQAGIAALVLALVDHPELLNTTGFHKFHHAYENLGPIKKPTGAMIRRGSGIVR